MVEPPRQHDITRRENEGMISTLLVLRRDFETATENKSLSRKEMTTISQQLDHLEHVLEFSATWVGVLTADFFPEQPEMHAYLKECGLSRLKGFFITKPFTEVCAALRTVNVKYPRLLLAMYERYYAHMGVLSQFSSNKK